jgi:hypothetical protein
MAEVIPFRVARLRSKDIGKLSTFDRDRAVFRLRADAGLSLQQCAEELGCTLEEVEQSLNRMLGFPPKR